MTSRPSTAAPIMAVLAILLPFASYVGGYFWLGTVTNATTPAGPVAVRVFPYRWQAVVFRPAASMDAFVRRSPVEVSSNEEISQLR